MQQIKQIPLRPVAAGASEKPATPHASSATAIEATRASFVLVEDDVLSGQVLSLGLSELGFKHLGSFTSGEDLLKSIAALKPDILLVDISLAGKLDGIQTVAKLSSDLHTRVIFLTGDDDENTLRCAMLLRPHAYLLKPLEVADVHASILTTLSRNPEFESALKSDLHAEMVLSTARTPGGSEPCELLLSFPQYAVLGKGFLSELSERAVVREGKAGTLLMQQGERARSTFLMVTGMAMCILQERDGRELTVHVAGPADALGLVLALSPLQKSFSVRLPCDARYISFPIDEVLLAINANHEFAKMMLNQAAKFALEMCTSASMMAYSDVEARILYMLQKLRASIGRQVGNFGAPSGRASDGFRVFLTRKELADIAGVTVESAIRATKQLERRGVLDLSRPGIIVVPSFAKLLEGHDEESEEDI